MGIFVIRLCVTYKSLCQSVSLLIGFENEKKIKIGFEPIGKHLITLIPPSPLTF